MSIFKSFISIDSTIQRSVYLQIADQIVHEVNLGRLKPGQALPGSRQLAKQLNLNRKTILQAYDELLAQGWIDILPYRGAFIKTSLPIVTPKAMAAAPVTKTKTAPKSQLHLKTINDGTPDFRLSPIDQLYKQARFVAKGAIGRTVLTGMHEYGEINLRETLSEYLFNSRALGGSYENIMITRGSQMSIFLALSVLLTKGDKVIVGRLNYRTADETVLAVGGELIRVAVDENGLDLNEVGRALKHHKIRAIYITPHHQYPTTVTMPVENRLALLKMIQTHNCYLIEDDYDYDYHYERTPILPIASLDQNERVIYIGSFSKLLAPSIRMGYTHASKNILDQCAKIRLYIDRRGDPILERALADLIKENEMQRSLKKAVATYHSRRDNMARYLKDELGDLIEFDIPAGGMAFWVRFNGVNVAELKDSTRKKGLFLDIDTYYLENYCRLGFASMNTNEMQDNCSILTECVKSLHR